MSAPRSNEDCDEARSTIADSRTSSYVCLGYFIKYLDQTNYSKFYPFFSEELLS